MSKIIQLLILSSLYSTFIYALDLNSTNEIIKQASEATNDLADEVSLVLNDYKEESEDNISKDISLTESNITVISIEENIANLEVNETNILEKEELTVDKGDPRKGKNIFKYVLKEDCNMTAFKFAEQYSQEEWIEILEEHKIKETIFKTCPNVKNYYQDKWTDDLYQFFYEASNEDEIPEC